MSDVQQNLIKYYENVSNMALKNLKAEKSFQFRKMLTNHSLLQVVQSHYESISKSEEAKKMIKDYMSSMNGMYKSARDDYNKTLKLLKATSDPIVKQRILDEYATRGIHGFTAKNGARWNIETYSNMCTTHFNNEITRLSVLENVPQDGKVQITTSSRPCPLCIPWENKILTLQELNYARSQGLFHVRCKHFAYPIRG
jgi:hypothetical protein